MRIEKTRTDLDDYRVPACQQIGAAWEVLLDGEPVTDWVSADDVVGMVERKAGAPVTGRVTIRWTGQERLLSRMITDPEVFDLDGWNGILRITNEPEPAKQTTLPEQAPATEEVTP